MKKAITTKGKTTLSKNKTAKAKSSSLKTKAVSKKTGAGTPKVPGVKKSSQPSGEKTGFSFFEDVWAVARLIPKGRVTSYGAIANYIGTRLSARMVGWAMNACDKVKPKVPAHRVVNRAGLLTGKVHFSPPEVMQQRLEKEGIQVADDKVVDFKNLFWDPAVELE